MNRVSSARPPKTHKVRITIPRDTRIKCDPHSLKVRRNDQIEWNCEDGPFVLQALRRLPGSIQHKHSSGAGPMLAIAKIPRKVKNGHYRYAVAVEKGGVVYIDARCPEIIIED